MAREVLVETDFLFGLSAGDKLYSQVMRVLERHRKGEIRIVVSSASPIEVSLTLLSRGMDIEIVAKVLKLMNTKLAEYRVNIYAPVTLEVIAKALELKKKYKTLTLFDSVHISLATILGIPLLTSDKTMQNTMEIENIEYLNYSII